MLFFIQRMSKKAWYENSYQAFSDKLFGFEIYERKKIQELSWKMI